ncbi:MAG: M1 family metallopeptidase [Gloeobacteraceae cyanobacterium ES-bin-316]|nr:M1 family metallopeptidase [Ferruginibacter sp.]
MNTKSTFLFLFATFLILVSKAQPGRWQQRVKYTMSVDMNVNSNQFAGKQKLEYTNNSPDKLNKIFYHLYFNAFQPNSSMDVHSRELGKIMINGRPDWDGRVKDRILKLKEDEIGYQKIKTITMNGISQPFKYHETILEVNLTKPILPNTKVILDMEFEAQVPLQVRRSGRDNPGTGVRYSMSQWYPKLCEYDKDGWHPNQYVAREFYGVWGDFDVTINIDRNYKLGGTGVLVNASEIGWGYDKPGTELKPTAKDKRSWHFVGNNIHDFMWAADPDYKHIVRKISGSTTVHVIFNDKPNDLKDDSAWTKVADVAVKVLPFIEQRFGKYPYPQYSFIHGGDGGMEYPMATLVSSPSLGTAIHEWMHSWYQMILGTNESLYAWMDEGFTSYAENLVTEFNTGFPDIANYEDALKKSPDNEGLKNMVEKVLPRQHSGAYSSYFNLVASGLEEPLTTHADYFNTNAGYGPAAYSKGEVFMEQLGYVVGAPTRDKILLEYYNQWRFKHPDANDFIKLAEDVSGMQLDWYQMFFVNSTKTIDYGIDSLWEENGTSKIRLKRTGYMPMPIDLQLTFKDGTTQMHYIPLNLMYAAKPSENAAQVRTVYEPWSWTHPTYVIEIKGKLTDLKKAEIDASKRMADVNRKNNVLDLNW